MKDLRAFTGGLDYDSDYRLVGPTDYVDAINVTTGTSAKGSLKNMFGNVEINFTLPDGDNTCIGSLRNIKANSIIYFVYNSLGNHSILEYMCETKIVEPILTPVASIPFTTNFLGFTKENKIHSSNIVDDILTWTDNNVSPRKINVKSAKEFLAQLPPSAATHPYDNLIATGTDAQKVQFIEFIKYKPSIPPSIESLFNPARKTSYIKEKMIQAKYRYIYDDNEYSRWSTGSITSYPGLENATGELPNSNNYIKVGYNTGHPTVREIEIAVRFGNTGVWGKIDTPIKKYDQNNQRVLNDYTDYYFDFYNDSVLIELAEDFNNYDSVPQVSKTQEIIDGNRIIFANNVEGYENPNMSVELDVTTNVVNIEEASIPIGSVVPPSGSNTFYYTGASSDVFDLYIPVIKPSYIVVGSTIRFKFRVYDSTVSYEKFYDISYVITYDDIAGYPSMLAEHLMEVIASATGITTYSFGQYSTTYWFVSIGKAGDGEYIDVNLATITPPLKKIPSFKKGANHVFGIVYRDAQGRDGGVVTGDYMSIYNPYLPESNPSATVNNKVAYKSSINVSISNQPPIWAHSYEIVYGLSDIQKYTQFLIKGLSAPNAQGNYSIDCSYIIDYITKERVTTSVDFQFETGDILRFISNAQKNVPSYTEVKVLSFDTTTNILTVAPFSRSVMETGMTVGTTEGMLVELYSIKQKSSLTIRPYFSFGKVFEVLNAGTANRVHAGDIDQDLTTGTPAEVLMDRGDCYIYRRIFKNNTLLTVVESENYSDFYSSQNIDISSVYGVIPNGKTTRYEHGLRYGGRYFPNTNINNLCQFNGEDYDTLTARYGPINKVATVGYVLKVLQTKKNTSIYINRSMIFNANGDDQLTLTDKVLGNKNPSELDFGCEHPESVCVDDRQLYFYDVNNGAFIQDAANGMVPVSEYKAKTYFRNISDKIKNNPNIYVYAGVDNFNNYINVSFVDTNEVPLIEDQTIVYHPIDNRWKSRMSYSPEYYGSNALVFVSFMNGKLYEHNRIDAPRCNYYGNQHSMKVKLVSNKDYPKVKVYTSIAVYADKTFSSPVLGDISIEPSVNYPNGMESRLVEAKWRWKEGVLYAQYLRDGLTPNFPTVDEAIMGGRKLRGETLAQQLENTDTDEATLYSVIVHGVDSELSK